MAARSGYISWSTPAWDAGVSARSPEHWRSAAPAERLTNRHWLCAAEQMQSAETSGLASCKTLASRSSQFEHAFELASSCPIPDRLPALQAIPRQAACLASWGCRRTRLPISTGWLPIYYSCYCIATMLVARRAEVPRNAAAKRTPFVISTTGTLGFASHAPTSTQ